VYDFTHNDINLESIEADRCHERRATPRIRPGRGNDGQTEHARDLARSACGSSGGMAPQASPSVL
jgi:hypothetical protein